MACFFHNVSFPNPGYQGPVQAIADNECPEVTNSGDQRPRDVALLSVGSPDPWPVCPLREAKREYAGKALRPMASSRADPKIAIE